MAINEGLNKRRRTVLIIILLLLLIIAALIYLYLSYFRKVIFTPVNQNINVNVPLTPTVIQPTTYNNPNMYVLADVENTAGAAPTSERTKQNILFIASSFTERFGSYSNQSNFKNFDELTVFMTDNMKTWATSSKEKLQKQYPDLNKYYALETKAISTQVNNLDDKTGKSEIMVKTQRQEFNNTISNPRIFYQELLLKLIKVNDEWKVDGAYWQ